MLYSHKIFNDFKAVASQFGYYEAESHSLVRSTVHKPFFTFSALQNVEHLFHINQKASPKLYKQFCYRTSDLKKVYYDPLTTEFQKILSIFNFEKVDISNYIEFMRDFFIYKLELNQSDFIVIASESNKYLLEQLKLFNFNVLVSDPSALKCEIPNIENAEYVKFLFKNEFGVVPLANLVLIDQSEYKSKLDSAFFFDRILFIKENKSNFFETRYFKPIVDTVSTQLNITSSGDCIYFASLIRTSIVLLLHDLTPSTKLVGYSLRKNLREAFSFLKLNRLEIRASQLDKLIQITLETLYSYDEFFEDKKTAVSSLSNCLMDEFNTFSENFSNQLRLLQKYLAKLPDETVSNETLTKLKGTTGISIDLIRQKCAFYNLKLEQDPLSKKYSNLVGRPYTFKSCGFDIENWYKNSRYFPKNNLINN